MEPNERQSESTAAPRATEHDLAYRLTAVEARLERVEAGLHAVEQDVAVIRSNYVTKAELKEAMLSQTWRILSTLALYTAGVYFIARNVH